MRKTTTIVIALLVAGFAAVVGPSMRGMSIMVTLNILLLVIRTQKLEFLNMRIFNAPLVLLLFHTFMKS